MCAQRNQIAASTIEALESQSLEVRMSEVEKKINKLVLYEIPREMLRIHSIPDLCQRLLESMQSAWSDYGNVFPMIEINGESYTLGKCNLASLHKLSASVIVNKQFLGQVCLCYNADQFGDWSNDEDVSLLQNIADDLGVWLERQHFFGLPRKEITITGRLLDEHVSIAITDRDGRIEYVNNQFCEISKYAAEELIGSNIRMIDSNYHEEAFMREMWHTITQGKIWKGEFRNRSKDGSIYWTNTTIMPFLDAAGIPYRYAGMHIEVTEYKEMKQKMEEQVAELARSNDELEQFAYVVTHDLQEPLRAIGSFVQLLKKYCDQQLDERANQLISHVVDGTIRMQMLIDDLLTYAQVNTSQAMTDIDCEKLLHNVLVDLSITISESGAIITHDKLPIVKGITFQMIQLFNNLIGNAIKFRRNQPPRIHIGVKEEPSEWIFSVTDNGIGMEEQYLDRIFRVFQRLHSRKEYAGTGIGLAICKKVVDYHKGKIWVKSQLNAGSEFYFTISKNI